MSLSHDQYPHIFDAIIRYAPFSALLTLRTASSTLRDRVDAALVRHIAIRVPIDPPPPFRARTMRDYLWSVRKGRHLRIPRIKWHETLDTAVRVVDIHTARDAYGAALQLAQSGLGLEPYPLGVIPQRNDNDGCWCGPDKTVGLLLEILAPRLLELRLVRQWGLHFCFTHLATPRKVSFYASSVPLSPTGIHTAPVNVIHLLFTEASTSFRMCPNEGHAEYIRGSKVIFRCSATGNIPCAAKPRTDNRFQNMLAQLYDTFSDHVEMGHSCTLVGPDSWPPMRVLYQQLRNKGLSSSSLADACISEIASRLSRRAGTSLPDALDLVPTHFKVVGEREYRAAVGDEVYALEAY